MINFNQHYFLERDDYKSANKKLLLADKIMNHFKKYSGKLSKIAVGKNELGYHFPVASIDNRYDDLIITLTTPDEDNPNKFGGYTQTSIIYPQHKGKNYDIIMLHVLLDKSYIDNPKMKNVFNSPKIKTALVHELSHYFESKTYKDTDVSLNYLKRQELLDLNAEDEAKRIEDLTTYYNFSDEMNARWNEAAVEFIRYIKNPKNERYLDYLDNKIMYPELEKSFIKSFGEPAFNKLTDENKKRIKKRFYLFLQEIIEVVNKKLDKKFNKQMRF